MITVLPAMLAGCGGAGKGNSLDSASLAPPANISLEQAKQAASQDALSANSPVVGRLAKIEKTRPVLGVEPVSKSMSNAVVTAKLEVPPPPVRRPRHKKRRKKSKMAATAVQKRKPVAPKKRQVSAPKRETMPPAPMVPEKVVPVQVAPTGVPQDIIDAFNEQPEEEKPEVEKVAEAKPVQNKHSFGHAEHNFSGR